MATAGNVAQQLPPPNGDIRDAGNGTQGSPTQEREGGLQYGKGREQGAQQQQRASNAGNNTNNQGQSSAAGGSGGGSGSVQHRRVYQACIPCRKRKVKCDLGSVDNPSAPPCVRCRREFKECFFSVTRRKQKLDENDEPIYDADFVDRNARKRTVSEAGSGLDDGPYGGERPTLLGRMSSGVGGGYRDTPLAPTTGGTGYQRGIGGRDERRNSDADPYRVMTNPEAQSTMRTEIYGPHDALNLLYKAATDE